MAIALGSKFSTFDPDHPGVRWCEIAKQRNDPDFAPDFDRAFNQDFDSNLDLDLNLDLDPDPNRVAISKM